MVRSRIPSTSMAGLERTASTLAAHSRMYGAARCWIASIGNSIAPLHSSYEPNGAEYEATHHPEETVYLANVHGAIAFYGEDKQIVGISDWRAMKALQEQ